MSTWEAVLAVAMVLVVVFFFGGGIKGVMKRSREVPSNWPAVVLPAVGLILFVILLISLVRS